MLKKTFLVAMTLAGFASSVSAISINLDPFNSDFNTLMNGIARDVAPSLRLGALSGDLQGDADIDTFNLTLPGIGFSATNGLGRVLQPGGAEWEFVLPLADLVNDNAGSNNFFEKFMIYPAVKFGVGVGLGAWDLSLTGMILPQAASEMGLSLIPDPDGTIKNLDPQLAFSNVGVQVRRVLISDSGFLGLTPAISLGAGYHYTTFVLDVTLSSLTDMGMDELPSVGDNQTLDMEGSFGVTTQSQVATIDLHVSKHLLNFTPYMKVSGAYQNSTFTGKANLVATVTDTTDNTFEEQTIVAKPTVNASDFAFLVTSGLDINLFLFNFNVNVVGDMSRAFLKVKDFSLNGIDANAFAINTGFRFSF